MAENPTAVVLGSVHMDLIAEAARLPRPGESIAGGSFAMAPGGKAGNQAAQLALCGVAAGVATRLGDDWFGGQLTAALTDRGVDVSPIIHDPDRPTGASTVLTAGEDYSSIIAPGAAEAFSNAEIARVGRLASTADALVLQFELPVDISARVAGAAKAGGALLVLNASPLPSSPDEDQIALMAMADILIVNRVEAARITPDASAEAVARETGAALAVVTRGAEGLAAWSETDACRLPAFGAKPVDTIGAGDACLGAFLAAHLQGAELKEALRRGAAAGALAVGRRGALDALPTMAEIDAFLEG